VVVDRDHVEAGLEGAQVDLDGLGAVRQHGGHDVAGGEAERPQGMDDLVGPS